MTTSRNSDPADDASQQLDQAIADLLVLSVWELRQAANHAFEPLDLNTFQVAILNLIAYEPQLRSGQLAERLGVIPVILSSMVTKLEKRSLLERFILPEDRRVHGFKLTAGGEAIRLEANKLWEAVTVSGQSEISRSDKEAILRVLKLIHGKQTDV